MYMYMFNVMCVSLLSLKSMWLAWPMYNVWIMYNVIILCVSVLSLKSMWLSWPMYNVIWVTLDSTWFNFVVHVVFGDESTTKNKPKMVTNLEIKHVESRVTHVQCHVCKRTEFEEHVTSMACSFAFRVTQLVDNGTQQLLLAFRLLREQIKCNSYVFLLKTKWRK